MYVAQTAVFLEREFLSKKNSGSMIDLDEVRDPQNNIEPELEHEQNVHKNVIAQETHVICKSSRIRH